MPNFAPLDPIDSVIDSDMSNIWPYLHLLVVQLPCKVMPLVTEVQLVLDKHSQLGSWKVYSRMGVNELTQPRGWHHLVASMGPCGHTIHLLTTSSQTTMANPSTYYWWMCVRVNISHQTSPSPICIYHMLQQACF